MRASNLIGIVILGLGVAALPLSAQANSCSNETLKGTFGFTSTTVQDNNTPPFFGELTGLDQFDGNGHGTETHTYARSDGSVSTDTVTFAYNVATDCTFTVTWTNTETFAGTIVLDGQQFYYVETSGACCGTAIIRRGQAARVHTHN